MKKLVYDSRYQGIDVTLPSERVEEACVGGVEGTFHLTVAGVYCILLWIDFLTNISIIAVLPSCELIVIVSLVSIAYRIVSLSTKRLPPLGQMNVIIMT